MVHGTDICGIESQARKPGWSWWTAERAEREGCLAEEVRFITENTADGSRLACRKLEQLSVGVFSITGCYTHSGAQWHLNYLKLTKIQFHLVHGRTGCRL